LESETGRKKREEIASTEKVKYRKPGFLAVHEAREAIF